MYMNQMIPLMQNLMQDVARRDDIAQIRHTLSVHDSRIRAMEQRMLQVDRSMTSGMSWIRSARAFPPGVFSATAGHRREHAWPARRAVRSVSGFSFLGR